MNKMYLGFFLTSWLPILVFTTLFTSFSNFLKISKWSFHFEMGKHVFPNKISHFINNKILGPSLVLFLDQRNWSNTTYNAWFEVHQMSFFYYHSHTKMTNIKHSYYVASIFSFENAIISKNISFFLHHFLRLYFLSFANLGPHDFFL
jgi:hypothetical protein